MPIDINKHQVDIDILKKQNVNDLLSIKELYRKIKELGEKIDQIKYVDSNLAKKLKKETKRMHMLTAAALLELDFTQPSLDYHSLMKLTKILTDNNMDDLKEMYRRMCFNVFAHNRDDHSKNFSYLYDEKNRKWSIVTKCVIVKEYNQDMKNKHVG